MTGKDYYKIETEGELSIERIRSLIFFYGPLIGNDALALYLNLQFRQNSLSFEQLNDLLSFLNSSVTVFEDQMAELNKAGLVKTLNDADRYIFILQLPMTRKQFIADDLLVRSLILRTSGPHYQQLCSQVTMYGNHEGFKDVSIRMDADGFALWNEKDETYVRDSKPVQKSGSTLFDVDRFLKDISTNLLPMRFRTRENLHEMARLADLYNISYDRMRTFLPNVADTETGQFDLNKLKYLCMNSKPAYRKVAESEYDVPCQIYLMSLLDGKELTDYDKKVIFKLSEDYHLSVPVINVLLRHALMSCDNRLIEKYVYAIASDLYHNNVNDADSALARLAKERKTTRKSADVPEYDPRKNKKLSKDQLNDLLALASRDDNG